MTISISLLSLAVVLQGSAPPQKPRPIEAQTPLFFALSVPNLDDAVRWYGDNLGFDVDYLPQAPDRVARAAILTSPGITIELVEHSRAFAVEKYVPDLKGRYLVQGIFKVGFYVANLDAWVAHLKERAARIQGSVIADPARGMRFVLVEDNNGNLIQLFERIERRPSR